MVANKHRGFQNQIKVSSVNVRVKFALISNLVIIPRVTEKDDCDIVSTDKKEKLGYG
jgi:hypothetical protein